MKGDFIIKEDKINEVIGVIIDNLNRKVETDEGVIHEEVKLGIEELTYDLYYLMSKEVVELHKRGE